MTWTIKKIFIIGFVVLNLTIAIFYLFHISKERKENPFDEDKSSRKSTLPEYTGEYHLDKEGRIMKQKLEEVENELEATKETLNKWRRIHRLKLVTIDTPEKHHFMRQLVGSVHKNHIDLTIAVYGLGLTMQQESEVRLWANTEYIDIKQTFVVTERKDEPKSPKENEADYWKPIVLRHAAEKYAKVLYIDANVILTGSIQEIEDHLERHGSYFVRTAKGSGSHALECSDKVIGYVFNGYAYENILIPQIKCALKKCSSFEKKMLGKPLEEFPSHRRDAIRCHNLIKTVELLDAIPRHSQYHCYIKFRDDFLISAAQLPRFPIKKIEKSEKIKIAIGFPSTTNGIPNPGLHNLPFLTELIPSLTRTITKEGDFVYKLYLAYDKGDPFYDNKENQKKLYEKVKFLVTGYPIEFEMIECVYSYGWTSFLWNSLFQHAMVDGYDYFYQVNDDLRFLTAGWSEQLTGVLKNNPVKSNLGAACPLDVNNPSTFTQVLVHRTHYDIFGFLYPPVFKNWYSDDWLSKVYDEVESTHKTKAQVKNMQTFGTRYSACATSGRALLDSSLRNGRQVIREWLKDYKN